MELYQYTVGMLSTNCYLLKTNQNNGILIDPGAQAEQLLEEIEKLGINLKKIVLTHGHYDHIGAVHDIKMATGAELSIHADDVEMLEDPRKNLASYFNAPYVPTKPDVIVQDGDTVVLDDISLNVLHTPGHTKGSCVLLGDNLMISGDTLFCGSVGRTDHYGGDYSALKQSLKKLYDLPGDYQVVAGHGRATTLEQERRTNPYMEILKS